MPKRSPTGFDAGSLSNSLNQSWLQVVLRISTVPRAVFFNVEFVVDFNNGEHRRRQTRVFETRVIRRIRGLRSQAPLFDAVLRFTAAVMRFATERNARRGSTTPATKNIYCKSTRTASIDSTATLFGTTEIQSCGVIIRFNPVTPGRFGARQCDSSVEK